MIVDDGGSLSFLDGAGYALRGDNNSDFWVFGIAPSTPLADENTPFTADTDGPVYRLRMNVEVTTVDMPTGTHRFKLQYALTSTGPWTDVGAVGSSETWRGVDNPTVEDGAPVAPSLRSSTDGQSYEEANPSASNPSFGAATSTARSEWDWVLEPNGVAGVVSYVFRMVKSDGTPFAQYTRFPQITTAPASLLSQQSYRWWENRKNITPDTPLQPENTPHTGVTPLEVLRLRLNVSLAQSNLAQGARSFKLQFATSTGGTWTDVGGQDATVIWRGDAIGGATTLDGATLPVLLLASSTVAGTFEEVNPSAVNPNAIFIADIVEWDWVLQNNTAPTDSYFFRMVRNDGTPLSSYVNYPEVTTAGPTFTQADYQWYLNRDNKKPTFALAGVNSPYEEASSPGVLRLRMNVEIGLIDLPKNGQVFKLQFSQATTTGPWTDVGAIGSLAAWRGFDNPSVNDGIDIGKAKLPSTDERESYEEANPSVPNPRSIGVGERGEWDWVVQNNNAPTESRFYFRMVKASGAPLDAYTNFPQVSATKPVIAFDDFESKSFSGGGGWLAPWATAGDVSIQKKGKPKQGKFHMRLQRNTGHADRSVDLSGEGQVTLQFWAKAVSFEGNETSSLSVSADGINFTVIHTWVDGDDDNVYRFHEFDLGSFPPPLNSTYTIAFDANMQQRKDRIFIDDLKLIGE